MACTGISLPLPIQCSKKRKLRYSTINSCNVPYNLRSPATYSLKTKKQWQSKKESETNWGCWAPGGSVNSEYVTERTNGKSWVRFPTEKDYFLCSWVRASWINVNNCPKRCDCIQFYGCLQKYNKTVIAASRWIIIDRKRSIYHHSVHSISGVYSDIYSLRESSGLFPRGFAPGLWNCSLIFI